jgi:hypothetical protein
MHRIGLVEKVYGLPSTSKKYGLCIQRKKNGFFPISYTIG